MENVELLAPAGSLDILKAAVFSGANAVYFGGKHFGARSFANNLDHDEIIEAVNFAHHYGVKVYVTMNTLLNEYELEMAMQEVAFLYQNRVDALIIQDLGLYYRITNEYPDFEIHASTQMHIHNLQGVKTCQKLGFKRVVLARESNLELIREATNQNIEIEVFVHGAICVAYSGQCLMSSQMKDRSGNKGVCAQCCRLPYELYGQDGKRIEHSDRYLLSPKDLNLLNHVPSLITAGVKSFKIEGRMKKKAYVCYITSLYRKAIDAYYKNEAFIYTDEMDYNLRNLFQRDFTDAYYTNDNDNAKFFSQNRPNHLGTSLGEVVRVEGYSVYIKLSNPLHQFDGIRFLNENDDGCVINYLYKDDLLVSSADKGEVVKIDVNFKVNKNQKVIKTSDYQFENQFEKLEYLQSVAINLKIVGHIGGILHIIVNSGDINFDVSSDITLQQAKKSTNLKDDIYTKLAKLKSTPYYIENIDYELDDVFIPGTILNNLRREIVEKLDDLRQKSFKRVINPFSFKYQEPVNNDYFCLIQTGDLIKAGDKEYRLLNLINPSSKYPEDNYLVVTELGALFINAKHKIAYYTLNVSNSYAYEFLKRLGFETVVLSTELNNDLIEKLIAAYKMRNNVSIRPFALKQGRRVLMYLKKDPCFFSDQRHLVLRHGGNGYDLQKTPELVKISEQKPYLISCELCDDLLILDNQ